MKTTLQLLIISSAIFAEDNQTEISFVRHISPSYIEVRCVHVELGRVVDEKVNIINKNNILKITASYYDSENIEIANERSVNPKYKYVYKIIMNGGSDKERFIPCGIQFLRDIQEKSADDFAAKNNMPGFYQFISLIDRR